MKEDNWKRYEKIAGKKMSEGKGSLSFTSYVNACLSLLDPTLDQVILELHQIKKGKS